MLRTGPLLDNRLLEIENRLNAGRFDEAQRLLAAIADLPDAEIATAYFATRLLFQRGRLDHGGVIQRLRELLTRAPDFPEAARMLAAAEAGILEPAAEAFRRATGAPPSPVPSGLLSPRSARSNSLPNQDIPRAPLVPHFTPRGGMPSYVPATPQAPPTQTGPKASLSPPGLSLGDEASSSVSSSGRGLAPVRAEKPLTPAERTPALGARPPGLPLIPSLEMPQIRNVSTLPPRAANASSAGLAQAPASNPASDPAAEVAAALAAGEPRRALLLSERAGLESSPELGLLAARALLALGERRRSLSELERLLRDPRLSPELRAAAARVLLELGEAELALEHARRALERDAENANALWVLNAAHDRLVEADRGAQLRSAGLSREHALELELDAPREESPRSAGPEPRSLSRPDLWGDVEAALRSGQRVLAVRALRSAAAQCLRGIPRRAGAEAWPQLAQSAARTFTELPVFRHFAPYDCSLFSVDRLDAVLSLVFGHADPAPPEPSIVQLLGAYVGESYRQAFGAEWQGAFAFPLSASVEGIGLSTRPCERVRARLQQGASLGLATPHSLHPGADPLGNSVPLSVTPPAPWDPEVYPSLALLRELGRNLQTSIIGLYCERALEMPLDLSLSGTVAVDRYAALIAPSKAPPDPDAGWAERAALLLGAYLGEVLVGSAGARWELEGRATSAESYRLSLPHGALAAPVQRVLERLTGRRVSPLSDYVARLASGRPSVNA